MNIYICMGPLCERTFVNVFVNGLFMNTHTHIYIWANYVNETFVNVFMNGLYGW